MSHIELLNSLTLPSFPSKLYSGESVLGKLRYRPLSESHAYPPCFIPIYEYGDEPSYSGVLRHFFVDRSQTFVNVLAYSGFYTYEIARTADQFAMRLFIQVIELEEEWNEKAVQAADELGIENAEQVFKLWEEKEDGCYEELPQFQQNKPYCPIFASYEYTGDFPTPGMRFELLRTCCSIEVEDVLTDKTVERVPPWLRTKEQKPVFDELMFHGDLAGCWMSANSRGWDWADLRKAVEKLASASDDRNLHLQAEEWLSHRHEAFSGCF